MKRAIWGLVPLTVWCALAQTGPAYDWNDLGLAAFNRGDYPEAERLYLKALDAWHAMGPQFEPHASTTLSNLGQALCQEGRWTEGVQRFEEGLTLARRTLGPKHIRTVMLLNGLGGALGVLGESARAESVLLEALAIERELYPKDLQTAHTLLVLSSFRMRQGRMQEAVQWGDEALAITLASEGEDSIESAMAYANIAQVRRNTHETALALPLFRKARAIYLKTVGPASPRLASTLSQEGLALMDDGKLSLADENMRSALAILTHCPGCQYEAAVAETNLGLLRTRQGKLSEAAQALTRALDLEQHYMGRPGAAMAATLQALSEVRTKQKRYQDAATLKARAVALETYRE